MVSVTKYKALMTALPSVGPARWSPWPLSFSGWKEESGPNPEGLNWL